ncbi:MAG: hypothetical protein KGN02_09975 [bacterium]|nr:hypothetical protein [bacterium]
MPLVISCGRDGLHAYVASLLASTFPDGVTHGVLGQVVDRALDRVEYCFARVALPGYARDGTPYLDHLHGDQSAVFWYYASNSAYEEFGDSALAAKFMLLNKARNAINVGYSTRLPKLLLMLHAVGTVLGRATYGDSLVVTQNVTVGTDRGRAPTLESGVVLYPGALVLGESRIGSRAKIAAGAVVLNQDVPDDSVAFGRSPDLRIKRSERNVLEEYFL